LIAEPEGTTRLVPGRGKDVARGAEAAADTDTDDIESPETYVGYKRAENFSSPEAVVQDQRRRISV
jgi:hypothetical protein